jgi:transcriptional antiterminator NusG
LTEETKVAKNWYVVHTYSGYENKVKDNLEKRIQSMEMQELIFQVLVPTVEEVEFKKGKRNNVLRKVFPGYVLVEMCLEDISWYVVRNTPGVVGFVGASDPGSKPPPLTTSEVDAILGRIGKKEPRVVAQFDVGQCVKILGGPFVDLVGYIDEVDVERERLRVLVNIFGRDTSVEIGFTQVQKV